jgi:hypothetical protein
MPVAEPLRATAETPAWLDSWVPWLVAAIALIVVAYGPPLAYMIANVDLSSAGMRVW